MAPVSRWAHFRFSFLFFPLFFCFLLLSFRHGMGKVVWWWWWGWGGERGEDTIKPRFIFSPFPSLGESSTNNVLTYMAIFILFWDKEGVHIVPSLQWKFVFICAKKKKKKKKKEGVNNNSFIHNTPTPSPPPPLAHPLPSRPPNKQLFGSIVWGFLSLH